jgi:hypothetical protein
MLRSHILAFAQQMIKQFFKYLVASFTVGVGQSALVYASKSKVIPTAGMGGQTGSNIPQAVFLSDLRI